MATSKAVLVMGIGVAPVQKLDTATIRVQVAAEAEKFSAAGINMVSYLIDPSSPNTIAEVKEKLKEKKWDAVSVGFGLRGNEDWTPLFENVVNLIVEEVKPLPKMVFATRPNNLFEAVERVCGKEFVGSK